MVKILTEVQKQKAIELAKKMGLRVSFTSDYGVFVDNGNEIKRFEFEDYFPELKNK